jgi:3-isopropylmalate dehydratase small subunit
LWLREKLSDADHLVKMPSSHYWVGKSNNVQTKRETNPCLNTGCGVQCVIAKSFAFIFQRNMPNLGLLGITITDDAFYDAAQDGFNVAINFSAKVVDVNGRKFGFELSQMERELFKHGGISSAFSKFGKQLFEVMRIPRNVKYVNSQTEVVSPYDGLQW